jgi:hypothetical protein
MMLMTEAPTELLCAPVMPAVRGSAAGEVLAKSAEFPAGPWLAVLVDQVDPTELPSWDLPAYLSASARVKAWAAARESDAVAEIASRVDVAGADKEVAIALSEPVGAATQRIWRAQRLRRMLPATRRRFRHGDLSQQHAEQMVDAISGVTDPEQAAEVETRALRSLGGKTAAELRKHARRILARLDPAGTEGRAKERREQADVSFYPDEDGVGGIVADGPVEDARIIKEAVDAAAITAKQNGDPRPVGLLRWKALTGWASDYLTGRSTSTACAPRSGGRPIDIGIVIDVNTALGHSDLPAEVPGCGIVPREAVAAIIAAEQPTLRVLVIDPDTGRLVHRGTASYRPTPDQVAKVRATWVTSAGPGSQVFAGRCDTDHAIPYPDGPTSEENLIAEDRTWHRGKTRGQLSVTLADDGSATWTTALGQSRTVTPYDYRLTDRDG